MNGIWISAFTNQERGGSTRDAKVQKWGNSSDRGDKDESYYFDECLKFSPRLQSEKSQTGRVERKDQHLEEPNRAYPVLQHAL
jgi:hypothetical protein